LEKLRRMSNVRVLAVGTQFCEGLIASVSRLCDATVLHAQNEKTFLREPCGRWMQTKDTYKALMCRAKICIEKAWMVGRCDKCCTSCKACCYIQVCAPCSHNGGAPIDGLVRAQQADFDASAPESAPKCQAAATPST